MLIMFKMNKLTCKRMNISVVWGECVDSCRSHIAIARGRNQTYYTVYNTLIIYIGSFLLFDSQRKNQVVDNHDQAGIHFTVCQYYINAKRTYIHTHVQIHTRTHTCNNAHTLHTTPRHTL